MYMTAAMEEKSDTDLGNYVLPKFMICLLILRSVLTISNFGPKIMLTKVLDSDSRLASKLDAIAVCQLFSFHM